MPPSVTCQPVPVSYLRDTLAPLFQQAYWEEVDIDPTWKPNPYWAHYEALEAAGKLLCIVLLVDSEPCGYFLAVLGKPLHYADKFIAQSDMFYITPEHRATYAVRLFRAAKDFAKLAGADKLYVNHKVYKDITPILTRLKFKPIETVSVVSLE